MRRILLFLPMVFLISGCSFFQGSKKIDMTPFSDNAETMFAEAVKVSRPFQWKHLKPYTNIPEFEHLEKIAIPLLEALRGIVYYSNQVVAINNARMSDKEKNRQLAIYLNEAMQKSAEKGKVDSLRLDELGIKTVMENIRNAEKYLDGIAAASPMVNTVVLALQDRLDEIEQNIPLILIGFDREIERDYGTIRTNFLKLKALQNQTMTSITRLYRARIGDRAELDTLIQHDASMKDYLPSAKTATPAQRKCS